MLTSSCRVKSFFTIFVKCLFCTHQPRWLKDHINSRRLAPGHSSQDWRLCTQGWCNYDWAFWGKQEGQLLLRCSGFWLASRLPLLVRSSWTVLMSFDMRQRNGSKSLQNAPNGMINAHILNMPQTFWQSFTQFINQMSGGNIPLEPKVILLRISKNMYLLQPSSCPWASFPL